MVSEILRLAADEREMLAERVCRAVDGRGPVVVSVGAESSRIAERFAMHAADVGASALMAIPPISVGLDEHELHGYFARIVAASELPVIVQIASGYVGKPMSIGFQARLLDDFGDRILFKPEASPIGPRLTALREATGGRARVFEGSGGIHLVDSFRRGIVGTMPGSELVWAIAQLWKSLVEGDEQRVRRVGLPIGAIIALQGNLDAYLAVEKYLLVKQGVFVNAVVRGPVGYRLDDETRSEVDRLFDLVQDSLADPGEILS